MLEAISGNPVLVEGVIVNDDEEAPSLLNPMTGQILVTNHVGKFIVDQADGTRSVDDIVNAVVGEFQGAREDVIAEEVRIFVQDAREKGILE